MRIFLLFAFLALAAPVRAAVARYAPDASAAIPRAAGKTRI